MLQPNLQKTFVTPSVGSGDKQQIENQTMKLFFRIVFKIVRAILGPIILAVDWLTTPKGVVRTRDKQALIDQHTRDLALYQFRTCPFCVKTRRAIKRLSLKIETRDALGDAASREQLMEGGGKIRVPCLRIPDEHGNVTWMYESNDIIQYLQERFA
jgi:glutaredoxin